MPSIRRNWCAHPRHLQTFPDGRKMFTKFGPKPNHPIGTRHISLDLCNHINQTSPAILNDSSLKLNENHWLCRKCYELEFNRSETAAYEQLHMEIQKLVMDENFSESDGQEDLQNSPNLIEEQQNYSMKKLNEVFKLFHIEPVVP